MIPASEWLPPALVGAFFTALGSFKVYGLCRGILGGRGQPFVRRLCGT